MGADHSTPLTATIELKLGAEEDIVTIREVNTNRGNVRRENNGDGRNYRSTGGFRSLNPQQRNQGQAEQHRSTGGCRSLNPQQRNQGQARAGQDPQRSQGQARAGQLVRPNVGLRAGNLHRNSGQGVRVGDANIVHRGRMSGSEALGSLRMTHGAHGAGQTGRRRVVETVTLDDSDSDNETLEEMEAKLAWMIEQRLKRKRSHQDRNNSL